MAAEKVLITTFSPLPALALAVPVAGAFLALRFGDRRPGARNLTAMVSTALTLILSALLARQVLGSGPVYFDLRIMKVGEGYRGLLTVDGVGAYFSLFASILWFAASLHASKYMEHEHRRPRFFFFLLLGEATTLGVFMARDFFTLYLFFEAMGLLGYFLVVHSETERARAAAAKYLAMTVIGGLCLLMGVMLYLSTADTASFVPRPESRWLAGPFPVVAVVLLVLGFGVKAGMVPVHVWLPDAHPAAPSPASALLSGVMIKAGAYGILRVVLSFMSYPLATEGGTAHGAGSAAHAPGGVEAGLRMLGFSIIWVAVATMFIGMVLALVQRDIKRTLAYSSVSQMGYILLGVGCLGYMGAEGAIGLSGALYHILNHALFKGCFFLAAGSILFCAHELDMYRLGGLWRKMPITCLCWCAAALGIMGIPLFNGFVSKTLIHHAAVEAHHLAGHIASATSGWVKAAEVLFVVTGGGTLAYITKMTYYVFFRRRASVEAGEGHGHHGSAEGGHEGHEVREAHPFMLAGTGVLALGVFAAGVFPGLVLRHLVGPVAEGVRGLDAHAVEHVVTMPVFVWANIREIFIPVGIGLTVFLLGAWPDLLGRERGFSIFRLRLPAWLGVDFWYLTLARGARSLLFACRRAYAPAKESVVRHLRQGAVFAVGTVRHVIYPALTQRPVELLSRTGGEMYTQARERLLPVIREYQGDLAVGALAIAVSLVLFLIIRLL
ncbi:MAG: complex I subunit 5 family protein [Candidatus Geothermincolales bacterium]